MTVAAGPQHLRDFTPGRVEHPLDSAGAVRQRRHQPPLAFQPVLDVLVDLRRRILDDGTVSREQHGEPARRSLSSPAR